jgi:hypothetical protein
VVINAGANATFRAIFRANPAGVYEWWFNETNRLAWGTNNPSQNTFTNSLTVTNAQWTNEGLYTLAVSNEYGWTRSTNAALTIRKPPVILVSPESQAVPAGSPALFSVVVTGTPPFRYSWKFNGTNLPVAIGTNAVLTLTNVQAGHVGDYWVVVTNLTGSATSLVATLTVRVAPVLGGVGYETGTGQMTFTLPTEAGVSYVIEYKDELDAAEWQHLRTVAGDGSVATIQDSMQAAPAQRFYRVRLE